MNIFNASLKIDAPRLDPHLASEKVLFRIFSFSLRDPSPPSSFSSPSWILHYPNSLLCLFLASFIFAAHVSQAQLFINSTFDPNFYKCVFSEVYLRYFLFKNILLDFLLLLSFVPLIALCSPPFPPLSLSRFLSHSLFLPRTQLQASFPRVTIEAPVT